MFNFELVHWIWFLNDVQNCKVPSMPKDFNASRMPIMQGFEYAWRIWYLIMPTFEQVLRILCLKMQRFAKIHEGWKFEGLAYDGRASTSFPLNLTCTSTSFWVVLSSCSPTGNKHFTSLVALHALAFKWINHGATSNFYNVFPTLIVLTTTSWHV